MKRILLATAAALALTAGAATAQGVADQVVGQLRDQGFTRVEVTTGPTQVKIEAIRGGTKVEYVYDLATGALLKQETGAVDGDDDTAPGVEYDRSGDDFVDGDDRGDDDDDGGDDDDDGGDDGEDGGDDDGEDDDRGHGNDDDGFDDDNPGRGHGDDGIPGGGRGGDDDGDDDDGDDDDDDGDDEGDDDDRG